MRVSSEFLEPVPLPAQRPARSAIQMDAAAEFQYLQIAPSQYFPPEGLVPQREPGVI